MRRLLMIGALACAASLPCHADTYTTFDFNGVVQNGIGGTGGTSTGTLTVDDSTDSISAINITVDFTLDAIVSDFTSITTQNQNPTDYFFTSDTGGAHLAIDIPASSLTTYTGGSCDVSCTIPDSFYGAPGGQGYYFDSWTLAPATAATPEPSGLTLLGTGCLAAAVAFRRRLTA